MIIDSDQGQSYFSAIYATCVYRALSDKPALSEQNSKYSERPSNRSDRPGKTQENQWPRNPVLTFWQSHEFALTMPATGLILVSGEIGDPLRPGWS